MNQVTTSNALPALPDFLKSLPKATLNDDLKSGLFVGAGITRLSLKASKFHIVKDGTVETITKADSDGEQAPVASLAVVILAANKGLYKTYFAKKYNPNDDDAAQAPDCYSYDGITPSPMSTHKQSAACASCEQNIWGSRTTEQGNKTRACSDNKLLAVMATGGITNELGPENKYGEVFQLKVTPSALSRSRADRNADPGSPYSFAEFVDGINQYPIGGGETTAVPVRAVSVKLFFDTKAEYPLLRFKLGRFLTEKEHAYAEERAKGDDVKAIISESPQAVVAPAKPALAAPVKEDDGEGLGITPIGSAGPKVVKLEAPPRKAAVDPDTGEDVPVEAVAAKPRGRPPKAKEPAPAATPVSAEMDDELEGLVAQFNK